MIQLSCDMPLPSICYYTIRAFLLAEFVALHTPFSSGTVFEIFNIRILVDFSGVALLYAHHAQSGKLLLKRELDAIQNILHSQYAQYKQSRESIDLINRKYHDLKHQIAVLRAEQDSNRRTAFLDEMEQEIKVYEAQNKTGNSVLDTLLTGKSLYCAKHQIELVCVANGALLDFMSAMDLCTIFGNALDNAIEYELPRLDWLICQTVEAFFVHPDDGKNSLPKKQREDFTWSIYLQHCSRRFSAP